MLRKLAIFFVLAPWAALAQQQVNFVSSGSVPTGMQNATVYSSVDGNVTTIWYGVPLPTNPVPIYNSGAPTQTCNSVVNTNVIAYNTSTSPAWTSYICTTGLSGYTWYQFGGGGSGGISGLTSGFIPISCTATTLCGNSPLDYNITNSGWLTSSVKLKVPQLGVGSAGTQTLFTTTADTVADLNTNFPCSSYPPVTIGSTITHYKAEVKDALNYNSPITGGGTIDTWAWCDGTNWNSGLSPQSGLADPGSNGIVKRTALNTTAIATSTDITAVLPAFTGDCTTSAGAVATNCAKAQTTLTDSSSVTWAVSGVQSNAVLTGAHATATRALNLSGIATGDYLTLIYLQDSTGGAYLTGGTGCTWKVKSTSGYGFTATSTFFASAPAASQQDLIKIYYDGTYCWTGVE